MAKSLDGKRKILIAATNPRTQKSLMEMVSTHISNCQFVFSSDGLDTISKLTNDAPHLLVIEEFLSRKTGTQVNEYVLKHKQFEEMATIIISEIPEVDLFVDEVVTGRVQFTSDFARDLPKYLARALNYVSHGDNAEFHLSFLATDEFLMREGDKPDYVYILRKGQLNALSNKTGKEVIFGSISPGEFVGEMAYINGEPRSASIKAMSNCELIRIPIDKLDHILFLKPAWAKALVKTLSRRVKSSNLKANQ